MQAAAVLDSRGDRLVEVLDQLAAWLRTTGVRLETYCAVGGRVGEVADELAVAGYDQVLPRLRS